MTEIITIAEDHSVSNSSGKFVLDLTIDNQNAVDRVEFALPESVGDPADWAWRVEIEQDGQTSFVALADDVVWIPRAGAVTYGKCQLQLVGVQPSGEGYNRVYKSRVFRANVLPAINAKLEAGTEAASAIDEVLLKVEGYKDAAAQSAQDAAGSAASAYEAQGKAEDAQTAAETAQGKAETAQTAAETAQSSAETARDAAQTAQRAAETARDTAKSAQSAAEAARDAASGSAQGAASSAIAASDSAEDAQGYADDAQSSAQDAQTAAGNAQTAAGQAAGSATTAQSHASAAQTARAGAEIAQSAAETAQGLAEDAQESAETARDAAQSAQSAAESAKSGAEAAKSGAETAKTAAETAAGNASDDAGAAASSASAAAQSAQAAQEAAQTALGIIDDEVIAGDSTWSSDKISAEIETISPDNESVGAKPWSSKQIIDALCPPLEETGNPVQCYPVAGYPLGVKASWEPRQEGTGDPSPENVRPIVGLDEVMVQRSGKNLIHVTASEPLTVNGVAWTITDGVIHAQGTASITSRYVAAENVFLPKGAYSVNPAQNIYYELFSGNSVIAQTLRSFTLESDFTGNIQLFVLNGNTVDVDIYPSIELGSTATAYAPYTGTTATLSLPSTVYGGEVDAATGEGVETWGRYEFTGNEGFSINAQIQQNSQKNAYQCNINVPNAFYTNAPAICNAFAFQIWSGYFIANSFSLISNSGGIIIQTDGIQSVEEFIAFLGAQHSAGTPVTIVYKLATPQPIQASGSQPLPALSGQNVLITNADSLTVTGRADPTHTIQTLSDRVAALESETIEGGTNA